MVIMFFHELKESMFQCFFLTGDAVMQTVTVNAMLNQVAAQCYGFQSCLGQRDSIIFAIFWQQLDTDNETLYEYVCIINNPPDTKSNSNSSHTAKQHSAVNIQLNIVTSYASRETMSLHYLYNFPLSLSHWRGTYFLAR